MTGKWPGSFARGELYNDDPTLGDARLCGTTASLCGIQAAREHRDADKLETAIRRDLMLHAFIFSLSGLPVLYSGDEIAQENDVFYHNDPYKAEDSRYLHRGDLDWSKAALRHDAASVEGRIFEGLRTLERFRAEHDAFDDQADVWLLETGNEHVLGIGRYFAGEQLLALFNFSDTQQQAYVDDPKSYDDALTGESRTAMTVTIPAGGFRWLIHQF